MGVDEHGTTIVLHSTGFATWWDETGPQPSSGGPQVDLEFESVEELEKVMAEVIAGGASTVHAVGGVPGDRARPRRSSGRPQSASTLRFGDVMEFRFRATSGQQATKLVSHGRVCLERLADKMRNAIIR